MAYRSMIALCMIAVLLEYSMTSDINDGDEVVDVSVEEDGGGINGTPSSASTQTGGGDRRMQVEFEGKNNGDPMFIGYNIMDEDRSGRSRYEDPFGGCRLRCPVGFSADDYHIHMHKKNRRIIKGGRDPIRGLWHQDWKERAH